MLVDRYEKQFIRDEPVYPDAKTFAGTYDQPYNMALFQKQTADGQPPLLLEALQTRRRALCTDPRDKVFALVGISKDNAKGTPVPSKGPHLHLDYSKTVVEVYRDVVRHLINKMGNLDVLSACQYKKALNGLPSCAPDWSIPRINSPIRDRDEWGNIHYASDLEISRVLYTEREWDVGDADGSDVLRILGTPVQSVAMVGAPHSYGHDWSQLREGWYQIALQCSYFMPDGTEMGPGDEIPMDSSGLDFNRQSVLDAFTQTCVFGRVTESLESDESKWKWHLARISAIESRRFFVTETGFMGIGPAEIEVGDQVVILEGARVPFVLRRLENDDGAWEVVGETYLHGFMKGEITKFEGVDGLEAQEFALK